MSDSDETGEDGDWFEEAIEDADTQPPTEEPTAIPEEVPPSDQLDSAETVGDESTIGETGDGTDDFGMGVDDDGTEDGTDDFGVGVDDGTEDGTDDFGVGVDDAGTEDVEPPSDGAADADSATGTAAPDGESAFEDLEAKPDQQAADAAAVDDETTEAPTGGELPPDADDATAGDEGDSESGEDASGDDAGSGDMVEADDGPSEGDTASSDDVEVDDDTSDGDDDGELFEDDFAAALSDADAPGGGGGGGGGGDFDMGGGGGDFGMGGGGGGGDSVDLSDDSLDMGGDAGFGGLGGGGGGSDSFDDEELESDIARIELGIEGLDAMIQGGVPERTLMVAIGSAGTGKTTFGLQFLEQGLSQGERAVYITLEETQHRVIRSATEKGLPFDEYHEDGQLAVVDIDPVEMANSLQSIRSELPRLIEEFGASRLVLDSVSLLEMMYEDQATRRNEIYDFTKALKNAGVTTMLTSEASSDSAYTSRHGLVEYLTDAVFILQYVRPSDFRETRLAIEIQKIRDAHHSRETKPYEITDEGLSVYRRANIF